MSWLSMLNSVPRTATVLFAFLILMASNTAADQAKPWQDPAVFHALSATTNAPIFVQVATTEDDLLLDDDSDDELLTDDDDLLLDDDSDDELLTDDDDLLLEDDSGDELLTDDDDLLLEDDSGDELLTDDDDLLLEDELDEELLTDDDDLLDDEEPVGEEVIKEVMDDGDAVDSEKVHSDLFIEENYPSANACATCHPKQYDEWSVSQHAYAQLSPIYMAMQRTINNLTSTTNGDFCIRCHNQVGMNLNESINISNLDRPSASREGITCIVGFVPTKVRCATCQLW